MIRNLTHLLDKVIVAIVGPDDVNAPVYDIINGL